MTHRHTENNISIIINGNIGSGKSKIQDILRGTPDYEVVDEPVEDWKSLGLLEEYYTDPKKRGYLFQSFAFISRLRNHVDQILNANKNINELNNTEYYKNNEQTKKKIKIFERSIYTDKYCFAQNAHDCGYIDNVEWKVYNKIFDEWISLVNKIKNDTVREIEVMVFIRCTPEKCLERIKKRNRKSEENITLEYLTKLNIIHEKWIDELRQKGATVYIIDSNKDWNGGHEEEYREYIKKTFADIIELNKK